MALPPGPRTPGLIQSPRFARRPLETLERCRREYGDVFTIKLVGFGKLVYIADPQAIRELFTGDQSDLLAGEANSFLEPILGKHSVLVLDGPPHLRQRRLLSPPFQGSRVAAFRSVVREVAEREIDGWQPGSELVLRERMRALTFEVICRAVFGVTEPERVERLRGALAAVIDSSPLLMAFPRLQADLGPWSPGGRMARRLRRADALIYDEIDRRRGVPDLEERSDVLSLLLRTRDEDGQPMSDAELRDELITLLGAGHETTATALAFAFELLLRHPPVLARLRAEIDADGGDEYLGAVMRETLRLRPVVDAAERRLVKPRRIGGFDLPAGVTVYPAIALVHRRPELYPEPEAFRPERFLESDVESYAWLPFGGGIRRCIGAALAQAEMIEALRVIVPRVELQPLRAEADPVVLRGVTLAPKYGVRVRVGSKKRLEAREQQLDDARGRAPDELAVDGVGRRLERHALADQPPHLVSGDQVGHG
jgi:cytochrome P450 family 135